MKLNSIDFKNKTFNCCGNTYYIRDEAIGYERLTKFVEWMPVVAVGKSHLELMSFIESVFNQMTSGGDDFKKSYFEVTTKLFNYKKSFEGANTEDFFNTNLDTILRFCALVCVTDNEDITIYNAAAIDRKIELFKKDMNMFDFFFLAKKLIPGYLQKLKDLLPKDAPEK